MQFCFVDETLINVPLFKAIIVDIAPTYLMQLSLTPSFCILFIRMQFSLPSYIHYATHV